MSPDFTPYINLTVFDKTVQSIYQDAVNYAKTAFPEFSPRVGTIENALLEGMSHATHSFALAVNRLPNGLLEGLLSLMGFSRNEATRAAATVEFEVAINTGVTIAASTVVSYDVYDEDGVLTQYLFETTEDLVVASGYTTGSVTVTAPAASEYPDILTPQSLTIVSTTPYVVSATLTTLSSVGSDSETDSEYFDRAVKFLASLNAALVTSSQLSNYLSVTYPTIGRFKVYDLTEAADMSLAAANVAGAVTIALCDANGDPIESTQKTSIDSNIESRVVAGLTVDMYDMKPFLVDVAIDIVVESGYSTASVSLAVSDAIEAYLSVAGWDFADAVTTKYLTTVASKVAGVKYVDDITLSLAWAHANCRVATTANVNLSTELENGDTLNGVTLATNDRVLVKNQSTGSQNGIYVVQASGAAVRATDANASSEFQRGSFVFVTSGTTGGNTGYYLTNTGTITLGTTAFTFVAFGEATYNTPNIDLDNKGAIPIGSCTTTAV